MARRTSRKRTSLRRNSRKYTYGLPQDVEVVEALGGGWMVLVRGFQWGTGEFPPDASGAYADTWNTRNEAITAYRDAQPRKRTGSVMKRRNSRRASLRRNGDVKLTNKQFGGYYAMKRGGPSANDGYNKQEYGMTYAQFRAIQRLEEEMSGMGGTVTLSQINKFLRGEKVMMSRASQSEIDAVAKAFAR